MKLFIKIILSNILFIVLLSANYNLNATVYPISSANELEDLTLSPGDTVIMLNGIWEDQEIDFVGIGTEAEPIVLMAENGGRVILTGESNISFGGEYLVVDGLLFKDGTPPSGAVVNFRTSSSNEASYCRLTNTKIIDYNPSSMTNEYKWVSMYGQYNRVDHCHFEGKTNEGALLVVWLDYQPNYHQIDNNYFGPRPELGINGGETIRVGTSDWSMYDSYTIVENNLFEECDGEIEIISSKSCKNIYRNNTFKNSQGSLTLRHGNECEVYNNFFFGDPEKNCGGIRVIGEDHKIYNNYLQNIVGDGYRAAISVVNGVPNSPLNRYFQVKRAEIVNNTLIDCEHPLVLGAGADEEKSLPPLDCFISNNVVATYNIYTPDLIEYEDEPINLLYQNNIMFGGDLGIPAQDGIEILDPIFVESDFWRPTDTSPVVAYGTTDFNYITFDIDGQERLTSIDAGCDQISEDTIINFPLTNQDVGVFWEDALKEVSAAEGGQKIKEYIESAFDGDIIILTTSGGIYEIDTSSILSNDITISAEPGLEERPIIVPTGLVSEFVKIEEGGRLQLSGINFEGGGNTENALFNVIGSSTDISESFNSSLTIEECTFNNFSHTYGGKVFHFYAGITLDWFHIINTKAFNVSQEFILFEEGSKATEFEIENCTFADIGKEVLYMNVVDQNEASVLINHCTINNIGFEGELHPMFTIDYTKANIYNSLFTNCRNQTAFEIFGANSEANFNLFWETGIGIASENASIGDNNIINSNPLYVDPENSQFSFLPGSPALYSASDNENLGDLYWSQFYHWGNNASLSEILINDEILEGFYSTIFEYVLGLEDPFSVNITAIPQDENATVNIVVPDEIPGVYTIEVAAEDQINTKTYFLSIHEIGSNAYLSDILVDSISIENFQSEILDYEAVIDNIESYTILAVTQDSFAAYRVIYPNSIPGRSFIEVTAENGVDQNYYSVSLTHSSSFELIKQKEFIKIFPNPSSNYININSNEIAVIRFFDSNGKLIKTEETIIGNHLVDISSLVSGSYILKIETIKGIQIEKVVVR